MNNSIGLSKFNENEYGCNITEILSSYVTVPHKRKAYMSLNDVASNNVPYNSFTINIKSDNDALFELGVIDIDKETRTIMSIRLDWDFFDSSMIRSINSVMQYIGYTVEASKDWF